MKLIDDFPSSRRPRLVGIVAIATVSLAVTSFTLSRLGHSNPVATVARSLILGFGTLAAAFALGDLLL